MPLISRLAPLCALLALAGCITPVPPAQPPSQTIVAVAPGSVPGVSGVGGASNGAKSALTASTANVTLTLGDERVFNDLLRDQNGLAPTGGVLWLSSDQSIATVNPLSGQVKAIAPGTATLTASLQSQPGIQAQIQVKVTNVGKAVQIVVTPANPQLPVGGQIDLKAEVHLADGTISSNVSWTSSDNTVAKVDLASGRVTALAPGRVTIKAAFAEDASQFSVASLTVADAATPTPAPTDTPTPTPSSTGTPTPSPTVTPTPSPTATATSDAAATP